MTTSQIKYKKQKLKKKSKNKKALAFIIDLIKQITRPRDLERFSGKKYYQDT